MKPWWKQPGCIPPQPSGAFGGRMEAVLAGSPRPSDPRRPLGCREEITQHLVRDRRDPEPAARARPGRVDDD